jgi:hypothetical protein
MKKKFLNSTAFFLFSALFSAFAFGQNICLVTADFDDAESYIVVWEQPANVADLDSVFIYRKQDTEQTYTKIGAQSVEELSFFLDTGSNTIKETFYRISFLDNQGNESTQSPWHRPVILDYQDGLLIWTTYEKEGQVDETWISGYACLRDETGLGFYSTMGYWETASGSTQTEWFDDEAAGFNDFTYQMQVDLPSCAVTRANINTSRSNIKRQYPNSEASVSESTLPAFQIAPNPVMETLFVNLDQRYNGNNYTISDASGRVIRSGLITATKQEISLADQKSGTYFFTVTLNDKNYTKAFLKN